MTEVYVQKVTEGYDNFGNLKSCNTRQPRPPPPKIVAVHHKKKTEGNDVKMASLKETEKRLRNSQRNNATPRLDKACLVKNLQTSVRKAFATKNRVLIPSQNSTPLQPITKKNSRSNEIASIRSGDSGSSIYGRTYGSRKEHTRQSSKTKKNFASLFRRMTKAVRSRVVPAEQDSFAGETLI